MFRKILILQTFLILFFLQSLFSQLPINQVLKTMQIDTNFVYNDSLLIQIPQSNILIQAPNYFRTTPDAPILAHSGTATTFEFKEYNAFPYIYLNEAILKEDFSKQNLKLLSSQEITLENGNPGVLHFFSFTTGEKEYKRIVLLTGDYHRSIWVNASCLKEFVPIMENLMIKSLKTVKFNNN